MITSSSISMETSIGKSRTNSNLHFRENAQQKNNPESVILLWDLLVGEETVGSLLY